MLRFGTVGGLCLSPRAPPPGPRIGLDGLVLPHRTGYGLSAAVRATAAPPPGGPEPGARRAGWSSPRAVRARRSPRPRIGLDGLVLKRRTGYNLPAPGRAEANRSPDGPQPRCRQADRSRALAGRAEANRSPDGLELTTDSACTAQHPASDRPGRPRPQAPDGLQPPRPRTSRSEPHAGRATTSLPPGGPEPRARRTSRSEPVTRRAGARLRQCVHGAAPGLGSAWTASSSSAGRATTSPPPDGPKRTVRRTSRSEPHAGRATTSLPPGGPEPRARRTGRSQPLAGRVGASRSPDGSEPAARRTGRSQPLAGRVGASRSPDGAEKGYSPGADVAFRASQSSMRTSGSSRERPRISSTRRMR